MKLLILFFTFTPFYFSSPGVQHDDISSETLIGCWTDSREEYKPDSNNRIFRPCDYMEFPVSRFRFSMELYEDNYCRWLYLAPNDAHKMKPGTWTFNQKENVLSIIDNKGNEVKKFTILSVDKQLLKIKAQ